MDKRSRTCQRFSDEICVLSDSMNKAFSGGCKTPNVPELILQRLVAMRDEIIRDEKTLSSDELVRLGQLIIFLEQSYRDHVQLRWMKSADANPFKSNATK